MKTANKSLFLFILLLPLGGLLAQNDPLGGRDSLVLENDRIQDVIDSDKPFYKAEYQTINTESEDPLTYNSQSFYVETDFEPEPPMVRPIDLEDELPGPQNYLRLGIGRFVTPSAQLYVHNGRDKDLDYGLQYSHQSAYNDVIELRKFRVDQGRLNGSYLIDNLGLQGHLSLYNTSYFNYAGDSLIDLGPDSLPNIRQLIEDSLRMSFTHFNIGGGIFSPQDLGADYRYKVGSNIGLYTDRRNNREIQMALMPEGGYQFTDQIDLSLESELSYTLGRIDTSTQNRFFVDLTPTLNFYNDRIQLTGGVKYNFFNNSIDSSGVSLLVPIVRVRYALQPGAFAIMVGYDGGMQQNAYSTMIRTNPYLQQSAYIKPTRQQMNIYAGVEGSIGSRINFAGRAYYQRNLDQMMFRSDDSIYFRPVYDSLTTVVGAFAEAGVQITESLELGAAFNFNVYNTTNQDSLTAKYFHAIPMRLDVYAGFKALDDRFTARGEFSLYGPTPMAEIQVTGSGGETFTEIDNRGAYLGLNLSADYRITDGFSVFVAGNNLLGVNYQRWYNYPERRFDVRAGLAFAF